MRPGGMLCHMCEIFFLELHHLLLLIQVARLRVTLRDDLVVASKFLSLILVSQALVRHVVLILLHAGRRHLLGQLSLADLHGIRRALTHLIPALTGVEASTLPAFDLLLRFRFWSHKLCLVLRRI